MPAHHQTQGHQAPIPATPRLALLIFVWTFAWGGSLLLARVGPGRWWDWQAMSWAAVVLNVAVGIGWIVAHARFLRGIDEFQRKIMQDALAITLGVGWVAGFGYVVADAADLIGRHVELGLFPALLAVVYVVAIGASHLRYR